MWTYLSGRERYVCDQCGSLVEWSSIPGVGKCGCVVFESYLKPRNNPPRSLEGTFKKIAKTKEIKHEKKRDA